MQSNKTKFIWLMVLVLPLFAFGADDGESRLITVSGKAHATVPTDELLIKFNLTTEGESFTAALKDADATVMRVRDALVTERQGPVLVESEVQVIAQKRITWGSKTKKLDHHLTLKVTDVEGELADLAMRMVDTVLALDPELALLEMRGVLSASARTDVRTSLLAAAMDDARRSASVMADKAGLILLPPRTIHPPGLTGGYHGSLEERVSVVSSYSSVGFRVSSNLVGSVNVDVELVVQYEAEAR